MLSFVAGKKVAERKSMFREKYSEPTINKSLVIIFYLMT
jgi:hypothetical protein